MKSYRDYPDWKSMEPVCNILYHIVDNQEEVKCNKWYVFQEENLNSYSDEYVEFIEFDSFEDAEEFFIFKLHQFDSDYLTESFEELRVAKGTEINLYLELAWT